MTEEKTPGTVETLTTKRKEKQRKQAEKQPKPSAVRIYQILKDAINHDGLHRLPRFPHNYYVYEPDEGTRLVLLEQDEQVVKIVNDESVVNAILDYTESQLPEAPDFHLTHRGATDAMRYWRGTTKPVPRPQVFRWKSEPGLTFTRLPWELQDGDCPTWGDLMDRMSNGEAFCHWLGALFYPESSLHQYAWLYGEGGDGKGAINRFLAKVFGPAYCSKQPPAPGDRFWTYGLMGKRIVVFPDCNSQAFVISGLFKSLTGGDPIDVEAKGRMSFTFHPEAKYLFLSNTKPTVTAEKSDQRRIIYCEFDKREDENEDPEFEQRLWAEGGAFLYNCLESYIGRYPAHGRIEVENEKLDEWIETQEEKFEAVFDEFFTISFDENDREYWVTGSELGKVVARAFKAPKEVEAFRNWLARRKDVHRHQLRYGDKFSRRYKGLKIKPQAATW